MSKNPRGPILPPTPPPIPDPVPDPKLLIQLINVDQAVLRECTESEPVAVRWNENPIIVTTPAGVRLGNVKAEDFEHVRARKSPSGVIATIDLLQGTCLVEVN